MDITLLKTFLAAANRAGYANESAQEITESDGSHTLAYEEGAWRFHDNFFGGEPFGGREVIFYEEKAIWMMVYYGRITDSGQDAHAVYGVLKHALKEFPKDLPLRGPAVFHEGDWTYEVAVTGDMSCFSGEERITNQGKTVYTAQFSGGLVDQA